MKDKIKEILVDVYQIDGRLEDEATERIFALISSSPPNDEAVNMKTKTKTSILTITKVFLILIVMCCFLSCSSNYGTNYTYKWKLAVIYTNGEKDTVNCQYDSFKGNECYLGLKISESGLLSGGGTEPCIIMGCGLYSEPVVCGVRKYEIQNLKL